MHWCPDCEISGSERPWLCHHSGSLQRQPTGRGDAEHNYCDVNRFWYLQHSTSQTFHPGIELLLHGKEQKQGDRLVEQIIVKTRWYPGPLLLAVYGFNLVEANVSVHQVEIYANTLWKISCSGNFQPSLKSVRLVRDQDVATVKVEKAPEKEEKQVLGVCLAGVLWSSGMISFKVWLF